VKEINSANRVLWINFLTSLAFGTLLFTIPIYAQDLEISFTALGRIGAIGSLVYTVSTIVSGILLDNINKTRFLTVSNFISALSILSFTLTYNEYSLMIVRVIFGFMSAAFWVSVSTVITWSSSSENLTESIGLYNFSWISAFIIGPFFGGLITTKYSYNEFFMILAFICFTSSILSHLLINSTSVTNHTRVQKDNYFIIILKDNFYSYASIIPFSIILGVYMAIIPGVLKKWGFTNYLIGILLTLANAARGLGFLKGTAYTQNNTRKSLQIISILLCLSLILMMITRTSASIALPLIIFGLMGGLITPMIQNHIAQKISSNNMGIAMGVHEAIYGLGMFMGPFIGGQIVEKYGSSTLFGVLALISTLLFPISYKIKSQ
jgi:predicted MFS family arabinose efflux permease